MDRIAIIGTAGRNKDIPMSLRLWQNMVDHALRTVPYGSHVVSGGAAWADHLAVVLFLGGHAKCLTLHLPAPFRDGRFVANGNGSGNAANYYHERFSRVIDRNTLEQINRAAEFDNCFGTVEDLPGYQGMFARNNKVAECEHMLAYTFGEGDIPADGGTLDTWNKCRGYKLHVPLHPML